MYTLFMLCIFAWGVRHVMRDLISELPVIKKAIGEAQLAIGEAQLLPRGGRTLPHERSQEMHHELGVSWFRWDPELDAELEFDRPTLRQSPERTYFGPMDMEVAGDQVLIYDLLLTSRVGKKTVEPSFHTVVAIKPPKLSLAPFVLRPHSILSQYQTAAVVKTETALDTLYDLETLAPFSLKALFQSELGNEVLIPFLNEHRWTVEWTGDWLIVYELNYLIPPKYLAEVALEVSEFFEILKSGPSAVGGKMKEFFAKV